MGEPQTMSAARFVGISKVLSLCFYWYYAQSKNNLRKSSRVALTVIPILVILPQSDERNETRTKEQNDDDGKRLPSAASRFRSR